MKPSVLIISVAFIFSTILSSCCHELQCANSFTLLNNFSLINFTKSELDTVVVRRFAQETNFTTPIDSFVLDSLNCQITLFYNNDSIPNCTVYDFVGNPFNITVGYDYEIFIPTTNTLAKISNLLEPERSEKVCFGSDYAPTSCINSYTSIYVNGQPQNNTSIITITK